VIRRTFGLGAGRLLSDSVLSVLGVALAYCLAFPPFAYYMPVRFATGGSLMPTGEWSDERVALLEIAAIQAAMLLTRRTRVSKFAAGA